MGQLKAGDTVRFVPVSLEEARRRLTIQEREIDSLRAESAYALLPSPPALSPVSRASCATSDGVPGRPAVVIRQDGDANILIEYGPTGAGSGPALSGSRADAGAGGARAARDHRRHARDPFAAGALRRSAPAARAADGGAGRGRGVAAGDRRHRGAVAHRAPAAVVGRSRRRASRSRSTRRRSAPTRPGAPATSSSSAASTGSTRSTTCAASSSTRSYLVLGLGDVYLGAPVATPLDPRHRLVTTKYNPARTWTPENAVGIGGAYLCVYGMEGPGGYQFVGRTCQMWNRFHETAEFPKGTPWLLRFFDQIRFYPVGEQELLAFRAAFPRGRVGLKIEETTFRFADYRGVSRRERRLDRGVPDAPAGCVRRGARALGRAAAAARGRRSVRRRAAGSSRRARSPSGPPSRAASGRSPFRREPVSRRAIGWSSSRR